MKSRRPLSLMIVVILILSSGLAAQEVADTSFLWPIADHKGTVRLPFGYVISPKINTQVLNDGFFFSVAEGTPLVAMGDGIISSSMSHVYLNPNMVNSVSFKGSPPDSDLRVSGYIPEQLFGQVGLNLGNGLTVYYDGLKHEIPVKAGQKVKKGDIIGYSGYMKCFFDEPTVHVAMSKQTRVTDIGKYLFGKEYAPKDYLIKEGPAYDAAKKYSTAQLQEDFTIFREALEEGHPGLYTYTNKEEFDRLFDEAYRKLGTPLTEEEFVCILSSLLSRIGCGHTNLIRSKAFIEANISLLPIDIAFVGDKCYVIKDWRDSLALASGTEIVTFDGRPSVEVRQVLRELCTGDGQNPAFQDSWINGASFKRYLFTAFGPARRYALETKGKDGEVASTTVPTMLRQEIVRRKMAALKKSQKQQPSDAVELKFLDSATAYMKVLDFGLFDKDRIIEFFKEIDQKKPANLILDLRGNPGGTDENLDFLYSFLANTDFQMEEYEKANKRGTYAFFKNTENYSADTPVNEEFRPAPGRDGLYFFPQKVSPQKDYHYDGKVCVLMDGGTFSAAAMLCGIMHRQKRAVLIGEETGGAYYQINAENFAYLMLKNTPVQIRIPLKKIVITEEIDPKMPVGHGVMPDYEAHKSLDDLTHGTVQGLLDPEHDSVLDYAKDLIAHKM